MKKVIILSAFCLGLFYTNAYGMGQKKSQHFDKAKIENRTNAENFKDYALMIYLLIADEKLNRPVNKDLQWSTSGYLQEWIDADLENIKKTEHTLNEINRLSKKYINSAGGLKHDPKATVYAGGCLDFYHSDELNQLMKYFVVNPNKIHR